MYRYDGVDQSTPECLEPRWCALPHRQRPDANSPPHRPRELPLTCARRAPMPRGPPMAEVSATISPSGPIVGTGDRLKSASVQMLWGERRGHGTIGAISTATDGAPHVATLSF